MSQYLFLSATMLLFLVSCLKETSVPIASSFELVIVEDKTSPVMVKLQNNSYGADEYEWTFEGGIPSSSIEPYLSAVTFADGGTHRIYLRVFNGSRYQELSKSFMLQAPIQVDFSY